MPKYVGHVRGELLHVVEVQIPETGRVGQILVVWLDEDCRIDEAALADKPEASA